MFNTYHLMNAELMEVAGERPSQTKVGQIIKLPKAVKACPWKHNKADMIPAGTYRIISRKGFVGGSQEVELVMAA